MRFPWAIGIMRLLINASQYERVRGQLELYLKDRPDWYRLKFLEISRALARHDGLSTDHSWTACLATLAQSPDILAAAAGNPHLAKAIRALQNMERLIADEHLAARERPCDCIDIRLDESARSQIICAIEDAIRQGRGLSLIRWGDGEAWAFEEPDEVSLLAIAEADNVRREELWWGEMPSPATRTDIKARMRASLRHADIIGAPSIYRLLRDLSAVPNRFGEHASQRGLATVINAVNSHGHPTILTEERCNHVLFDRPMLNALADLARRVVWISCWHPDQLKLDSETPQFHIGVPAEVQVETRALHSVKPFWQCYPELLSQMTTLAGSGVLVLVAAGVIGKIFLDEAKAAGAVALDLGAVADYLAGYKTRSAADAV